MTLKSGTIRVGVIHCDTHAFWYAHYFDRPDAALMRKNHRGCHYYFYTPDAPGTLRVRPARGMRITRVFDEKNPDRAEALAETLSGRPRICETLGEVSDEVDLVYVANCNGDGKDHVRFAAPGLKKGVPLFCDMPFGYTLEEARRIVGLARAHQTAVLCGFMLRESPHFKRFRRRFADIAPVARLVVPIFGPTLENACCGLTIAQCIMGDGCEWVESGGQGPYDLLRMHYPGPARGTEVFVVNDSPPVPGRRAYSSTYHHCGYTVSAYGASGATHSRRVDDYVFMDGGRRLAVLAKRMAQTRKPPVAYESLLELMEMIEAARLAHKTGKRVTLDAIR